jgi:hypothetical protein
MANIENLTPFEKGSVPETPTAALKAARTEAPLHGSGWKQSSQQRTPLRARMKS